MTRDRLLRASPVLLVLGVLYAARGLLSALIRGELMVGHDATAYAIYVTEFHDNIRSWNLFPVWGQHLQFGFGEPHLLLRPPLQLYLTEFFYLLTGHSFRAINLTNLTFLIFAALGMYLALREILGLLWEPRPEHRLWSATGAIGFALSPYLLVDLYVRGAFSELSLFPVFPFFFLTLVRLARAPTPSRAGAAAIAIALMGMTHATSLLLFAPATAVILFALRDSLPAPRRWLYAGLILGLFGSAMYWLPAFVEARAMKTALNNVDFEAYPGHFVLLRELLWMGRDPSHNGLSFFLGVLPLSGFFVTLLLWSQQPSWKALPYSISRVLRFGLLLTIGYAYLLHRTSSGIYELVPILQVLSFPWRAIGPITCVGAILGIVALKAWQPSRGLFVCLVLLVALIIQGTVFNAPLPGTTHTNPLAFDGPEIARKGMGWLKPYASPSTAASLPTSVAPALATPLSGRADVRCTRPSPTQLECAGMAIQPSKLELAILGFPGWSLSIDDRPQSLVLHPLRGTILATLEPGSHKIVAELRATPIQVFARALSLLALGLALFLCVRGMPHKLSLK